MFVMVVGIIKISSLIKATGVGVRFGKATTNNLSVKKELKLLM
jgi:hypothetical protein